MEYGVTVMVNASPLENPSISLRDPAVWQETFGGGSTQSGVSVTPASAMGYPPVWRAINLISGDVASLPLKVYRRMPDGGKEPATSLPSYNLMRRKASMDVKAFDMIRTLTSHALLRGNGYAAIIRNGRRDPVELILLDPSETYPAKVNGELWYVTQVEGDEIKLRARDVLHIRGLSADNYVGYDVVTVMAEALGVGMAAQRFGARFFGHGANMSGLLMVPGFFPEEKIRNTMEAWKSMQSGLDNSHKVALLQEGVKFQQLQMSPEQSQFLQTREHEVRQTVASILGCPPHKLGDPTRTSHNSLEQENVSYLNDCLKPWLREWEAECDDKLLSETQYANDTHFFAFNRNALLQMEAKDRAEVYARHLEHGTLTINDVLRAEDLPTVGDLGDRRYRPANLVEINEESDAELAQQQMQNQPDDEDDSEQDEDTETETSEEDETESRESAMLKAMVTSSVTKALEIEAQRIVKAAGKETNLVAWMDKFYPQWVANAELPSPESHAAFADHSIRSQKEIFDVVSCSTPESLSSAVADCVATWSDRGNIITERILGKSNG